MSSGDSCGLWVKIIRDVLEEEPHRDITIPKNTIAHPSICGFRRRIGFPKGQIADWDMVLPDGRGVHVREYSDYYRIHWDRVSPFVSRIGHLKRDAPGLFVLSVTGLSGLLGTIVSGALSSIIDWSVLGAIISVLFVFKG